MISAFITALGTASLLSDFTFTFHSHAFEKAMAPHSSVLAWRIPGTAEPGGLPSMGSHRVRHDWRDLAAAAAAVSDILKLSWFLIRSWIHLFVKPHFSFWLGKYGYNYSSYHSRLCFWVIDPCSSHKVCISKEQALGHFITINHNPSSSLLFSLSSSLNSLFIIGNIPGRVVHLY